MTAFIDCGEHYLNYEVTAFGANYEFAHVVDFGIWPDQNYPVTKKRSFCRTPSRRGINSKIWAPR